jgi:hypothetical protein
MNERELFQMNGVPGGSPVITAVAVEGGGTLACCNASALQETQNRRRFPMEPTVIRGMSGN